MEWFAELIDDLALWIFALMLIAGLIGAREFGGWLHRRIAGDKDGAPEDDADKSFLITAALGLLALLIAFTFSLSLNRYDERRMTVVAEANAIGTAEMRVRLLNAPDNARLAGMLQSYARARLEYGLAAAAKKHVLKEKSAALRSQLRAAALTAVAPEARNELGVFVMSAINDVLEIGTARETLNEARIPGAILFDLIAYNLLTAAMLGYALTGRRARQRAATIALFVLLTLAITLVLDLDRPQRGLIKIDQTPMRHLVEGFAALPQVNLR